MTEARTPDRAECLHCGSDFAPRKAGHVFCSIPCRHGGELAPHERLKVDPAAIERLFDGRRDPDERVRPDDWYPHPGSPFEPLFAYDTVGGRRRWYEAIRG